MRFDQRIEVLPPAQQKFWLERPAIPPGFVLYGGTAIALRLGHRSSQDFDFFSSRPFETASLLAAIAFASDAAILQSAANTLTLQVDRGGPVKLSFFGGLSFGRVGTPEALANQSFSIASLPDLFAAKLKVLWQRAEAKDYIDVAAILSTGLSLEYGLGCAAALSDAQFNPAIVLKALTYFEDGDLPSLDLTTRQFLIEAAATVREIPEVRCVASQLMDF